MFPDDPADPSEPEELLYCAPVNAIFAPTLNHSFGLCCKLIRVEYLVYPELVV